MITTKKTIGSRVKRLREAKEWSQRELGEQVGASRDAVAGWEGGKSSPDPDTLKLLANVLGTTMDYLAGRQNSPVCKEPAPTYDITPALPTGAIPLGPTVLLPIYTNLTDDPYTVPQTPGGYMVIDTDLIKGDISNYYWLRITDDSMTDEGFMQNGLALIHRQETVADGDLALIIIDDLPAIVRKLFHVGDSVLLIPANTSREQKYGADQIHILGKAVASFNIR